MRVIVKTFVCGAGDCIFFIIKDDNDSKQFSLMIDCGKFTSEIKCFIENDLNSKIDVMIATHIDNDHISGMAQMLHEMPLLSIGKIFFNCYQEFGGKDLDNIDYIDEKSSVLLSSIQTPLPEAEVKINSTDACLLSVEIGKNWHDVWEKNLITNDSSDIDLGERFGKILFLSPTANDLAKLKEKYKREFNRYTHIVFTDDDFNNQQKYYETIQLFLQARKKHFDAIKIQAHTDIVSLLSLKEAKEFKPNAMSIENACSIAFEWECDGHKVLFLGDSDPDKVADAIKCKFGEGIRHYDVIKMSHHGSQHSTSEKLLETVDSECFLYTGGNNTDRPSLESIAKVVMRPLPEECSIRRIYCNRVSNPIVKQLSEDETSDIKSQHHFIFEKNDTLEFTY